MNLHRNTIWLVPLLILVTFPVWSVPVAEFLTPHGGFDPELKNRKTDVHKFTMESVKILQNRDGKNSAVIRAARARTGKTLNVYIMDEVDADIYDKDYNITKIVAKTGQFDTTSSVLTLIDNVIVDKSSDHQLLRTDLLVYNGKLRTVTCPGKTKLEAEGATIDGGSLFYDILNKSYIIDRGVTCILTNFSKP